MAEGARSGVGDVVVGRIGDDVELSGHAAGGAVAEPKGASRQLLTVEMPIRVASPAAVD